MSTSTRSGQDAGRPALLDLIELAIRDRSNDPPVALSVAGAYVSDVQRPHRSAGEQELPGLRRDVGPSISGAESLIPGDATHKVLSDAGAVVDWLRSPETGLVGRPLLIFPPWSRPPRQADDPLTRVVEAIALAEDDFPLCGVLVPSAWVRSGRSERGNLFDRRPASIVIHATNRSRVLGGVAPMLEMALVIVDRDDRTPELTRMFQLAFEPASRDEIVSDFRSLLGQQGGRTRWGYVIRERLHPSEPLGFERHDPRLQARADELQMLDGATRLADQFEVLRSPHRIGPGPRPGPGLGDGQVRALGGRNLRPDGFLDLEELRSVDRTEGTPLLQHGDLCVRAVRQFGGEQLRVSVIPDLDEDLTWDQHVLVLRPRDAPDEEYSQFIAEFLRSQRAAELVGRDATGHHVTPRSMAALPIPPRDEALAATFAELRHTADQFRAWAADADLVREEVFGEASLDEARQRALSFGQRVRQRRMAAGQLDNLYVRIRTQFPHPIAFRWRTVEGQRPDSDGYLAVLDCAEVALCYAAMVGAVAARQNGVEVAAIRELARRLADRRSGTTFGDWTGVLRELAGRRMKQLPSDAPLCRVREVLGTGECDAAVNRLTTRRNDQAHGRRVREHELPDAFAEARTDLETLLKSLEPLADYRLRLVERVDFDAIENLSKLEVRDLIGDHSLVPISNEITTQPGIEQGSLYLVEPGGSMFLLRPFLTARLCPECGTRSIFHLDTAGEASCTLKSLEHGHTVEAPDAFSPLVAVGMLESRSDS